MARARNIKPAFFKNDILSDMDPHTRLFFIGLWCLADREGRLEDRPKRIRVDIFPYETHLDADKMIDDLKDAGFLLRYEVNETRYIQIMNFAKHQNPHHKEVPSDIPPPPPSKNPSTVHPKTMDDSCMTHPPKISPAPTPSPQPDSLQSDSPPTKPYPQAPHAKGNGDFKNGIREGHPFNITVHLSDRGWEAARKAADGWDIYRLADIYNRGVNDRGGQPKFPDKAFVAWCAKYTKGQPPA